MTNCPRRSAISVIIFIGFLLAHITTTSFSIAIVRMVQPESNLTTPNSTSTYTEKRFNWSARQKNDILGIYLLGYVCFEIIGGRLSEIFGPRLIFGNGVLFGGIFCVIFPLACYINYYVALIARLCTGLALGFTISSTHSLAIKWFPPSKRSSFMGKFGACSLGDGLALLCSGYIIDMFGWQSIFYFYGLLDILWSIFWFWNVYDSPEKHPRISLTETAHIMEEIQNEEQANNNRNNRKSNKLPIKEIFTSIPVWAIYFTFVFMGFCQFTYVNYMPLYFSNILHFDIKQSGFLSSLPFIASFIFAYTSSYCADALIKSKKFSIIFIRKLLDGISLFGAGFLVLLLTIWGRNTIFCVTIFVLSFGMKGISYSGHMISALDIAPNFSASITSIGFTIAAFCGWIGTKIVNALTELDDSYDNWQKIFILLSGAFFLGGVCFLTMGSGEIQHWNNSKEAEEETVRLRQTNQNQI